MKYSVTHTTAYHYSETVPLGHNQARLRPRTFERQRCEFSHLAINPAPKAQESWLDYFGNEVTYFTLEEGHQELSVTARSIVTLLDQPSPISAETPPWELVRDRMVANDRSPDDEVLAAAPFTFESPQIRYSAEAIEYAVPSFPPGRPLLEAVLDLSDRIHRDFKYDPTATSVQTHVQEVLKKRRGVCQDFAHLGITCLRSLRLPARYISGYLVTDPPPGRAKMIGADASHAWLSCYCPGYGWLDVDPTNNLMPNLRHVTLGWGRDYTDVCPVKGLFIAGGNHTMQIAVDVSPVLP